MSELWTYHPSLGEEGADSLIELTAEEARHVQTRRFRAGDSIVLFDGRGSTAEASLEVVARREVRAKLTASPVTLPKPENGLLLATAIPKGDRLSSMLQMLSQLGLGRWQPLVCADSAIRSLDPTSSRLQRIVIESCKVARRAWALEIAEPVDLDTILLGHEGLVDYGDREAPGVGLDSAASLLVIGPEAGFSAGERAALREKGARPRNFGAHNLRIETAAIAGFTAHHVARGAVGEKGEASDGS